MLRDFFRKVFFVFLDAVSDALSRPETLTARLFELRAADLLHGQDATTARSILSGLLIGAELAATRPWWLGREVIDRYVEQWTVAIEDLSPVVRRVRDARDRGRLRDVRRLLPKERPYPCGDWGRALGIDG